MKKCQFHEISFYCLGDQTTEGAKKSSRSKRNRKRGKRKPENAAKSTHHSVEENKENQASAQCGNSKENVSEDWLADDSDDEEPKYIWRNVTKG